MATESEMQMPKNAVLRRIILVQDKGRGDELVKEVQDTGKRLPQNIEECLELLYEPSLSVIEGVEEEKTFYAEPLSTEASPVIPEDGLPPTLNSKLELRKELEVEETKPFWREDPYKDIRSLLLPGMTVPAPYVVKDYDLSPDDYSSESDEPTRKTWKTPKRFKLPDLNMYSKDYWSSRKKVKNLRIGNDLCVIVTLDLMQQMDLKNEECLYGIIDAGGIETLLNILDKDHFSNQISALKLLDKLAENDIVKGIMVNQGVPDFCFKFMAHENSEIVNECSKIILKLCRLRYMRAYCRKSKSLEILLHFAEMDEKFFNKKELPELPPLEMRWYNSGVNCLRAIDCLFNSRAVRLALYRLGFVSLLGKLINAANEEFYNMGIRMITLAASVDSYIQIFIEEGFMDYVYKKYTSKEPTVHLEMLRVVDKCLNNAKCKHWMLKRGLFNFLIEEFKTTSNKTLKHTMACIMRFANIEKYRKKLNESELIPRLFTLFDHPSAKIRDYAGSLMGQLSRYPKNVQEIAGPQNIGVMKLLEYIQKNTDYVLVGHIYKVICDLSYDDGIYWDICDVTDPIAILWGGVTSKHPRINEYGCSALVPYIGPVPDSIERVCRIPGSLQDVMKITYRDDDGAKAGAVTLLARLCQNRLTFKSLMQEGFDQRLFDLAKNATHPRLRYAIGYGFGSCARTQRISFSLGKRGAVNILIDWLMNDPNKYAQLGIITGLWKLSYEPINCKIIIQAKVVERLTYLTKGNNECLQNSIAGLLVNMRYLGRAAELMKNVHRPHPPEPGIGVAGDPDIIHPFQYTDDKDDTPV